MASKTVRGIRDTIPAGHFIGRLPGSDGPAQVIPMSLVLTQVLISGGSGATPNFMDNQSPSGAVNSINDTFILPISPAPVGSLSLYKNGVLMKAGGYDYTLTGFTIVFVTAAIPQTGDALA